MSEASKLQQAIPILRIFSSKTKSSISASWASPGIGSIASATTSALCAGLAQRIVLHLSEHHGDACPGSATMIMLQGIDEYHREVAAKDYRYYKPGIEDEPWGARVMKVTDPFGNRLIFAEPNAQK
jgi:hypothetical protein